MKKKKNQDDMLKLDDTDYGYNVSQTFMGNQ